MDQSFVRGHWMIGMPFEQKALYGAAIAEFQKGFDLSRASPIALGNLGHPYALSGNRENSRQALADRRELSKRRYVSPLGTSLIYTGLSDKERAFEWLEKAFEDRYWQMLRLKVDPRFDRLRPNPRFTGLLRRRGLER